jgi:hypothetical protein
MNWIGLKKPHINKSTNKPMGFEYLICNGDSMGRWTTNFGPHCLADNSDCKGFVNLKHKMEPESEIVNFEVSEKPKVVLEKMKSQTVAGDIIDVSDWSGSLYKELYEKIKDNLVMVGAEDNKIQIIIKNDVFVQTVIDFIDEAYAREYQLEFSENTNFGYMMIFECEDK